MSENDIKRYDEINLYDVWEKLRQGWKTVVVSMVLGTAAAVAAIVLMPSRYESVGIVQVGQLARQVQSTVLSNNQMIDRWYPIQPVESPIQAVERIRTAAFQTRVFEKFTAQNGVRAEIIKSTASDVSTLNQFKIVGPSSEHVISVHAQIVKSTALEVSPLIQLKIIGASPEHLTKIGQVVVAELASSQEPMSRSWTTLIEEEIRLMEERIARAERELNDSKKRSLDGGRKANRDVDAAFIAGFEERGSQYVSAQRHAVLAAKAALAATRPAQSIEPFTVVGPISPKRNLLLVIGVCGGLLAGVVLVLVIDAWRRAKQIRGQ